LSRKAAMEMPTHRRYHCLQSKDQNSPPSICNVLQRESVFPHHTLDSQNVPLFSPHPVAVLPKKALPLRELVVNVPTIPNTVSKDALGYHRELNSSCIDKATPIQFTNMQQRETKIRYFTCKECNKEYVSPSALKMHVRTHTLPCKCTVCGKSFSRPWLLQGHMRTHTGEKPYSCSMCFRSFADKSNLRAHLQTHQENKKHCCNICGKKFSRMSILNKHNINGCKRSLTRDEECVQTLISFSSGIRS